MIQFYLLSVLLNALTGFVILFAERDDERAPGKIPDVLYDETFRLVLGTLTGVVGFFKFLTVVRGDVPVVGDLLPALGGLLGAFILLYEFYKSRNEFTEEGLSPMVRSVVLAKKYIGIACIAVAILHFLFPVVLFL